MQREHIQGAGGHFLLLTNLANISQTSVIVIHHAWTQLYNEISFIDTSQGLINFRSYMNLFSIVGCV